MRIAIVEDEEAAYEHLAGLIEEYQKETSHEISYVRFDNGLKLIEGYKPEYDLIFLDIDTPFLNGIKASQELRKIDSSVNTVFVTNLKQYALKGYQVNALDFFIKPVRYLDLKNLLNRLIKKRIMTGKSVVIRNQKGIFRINVQDITYLEVLKHYVIYHTIEGEYSFYGSLDAEIKRLPTELFSFCNKCYYVNLSYVEKVISDDVYIQNVPLKISRGKKQEFLKDMATYFSKQ